MKLELGKQELKVLEELAFGEYRNISELAEALGRSPGRVSKVLRSLGEKGFVEKRKKGVSREVHLSGYKHAVSFKRMASQHPHMKFDELLHGSALEMLLPLTYGKFKAREIAGLAGVSGVTVKRRLKELKEKGVVVREEGLYSIGPFYPWLADFIQEFQSSINWNLARSFSKTAVVLWERGKEFLMKAEEEKEVENFFPTCYEKMSGFGVNLVLTGSRYYFYSPRRERLRPEDVALHTLYLEKTPRNILYVLLLLAKNPPEWGYMEREARKFGLEWLVKDISRYLETEGKHRPGYFPGWGEFKEKAGEYGIWFKSSTGVM